MRYLFTFMLRNLRAHPLRAILTVLGITVAMLSFVMIQTMVDSWYAGVRASAKNRLITRNSVSLVFSLPYAYVSKVPQIPGITKVGYANWFGGIYKEEKNRFAQFAIDSNYLDLYPEFLLSNEARKSFDDDKRGVIVGKDLAEKFNFQIGQPIQISGTIYPGTWDFIVRGIFNGREEGTNTKLLFFHWSYLNDQVKATKLSAGDSIGIMVVGLTPDASPAAVSKAIDDRFANSYAETLTESETAFQQSFVSMSSTIIIALNLVSSVVVVIILLVLANTLLMASRERYKDFAILRTLGFRWTHLSAVVLGESFVLVTTAMILLSLILAVIFSLPPQKLLGELATFFPVFRLDYSVLFISIALAFFLSLLAGIPPLISISRMKITQAIRTLG